MSPKDVVLRFNKECLEQGLDASFQELVAPDFINHTAFPGIDPGIDGLIYFISMLRAAVPDLHVDIHEMIAESDTVVTRKTLRGTLQAPFMGLPGDGRTITMPTIDIVKIRDGQYVAHWAERHVE
jgi:steroid delta-isomerase-like uncharacterized protein